MHVIGFTGLKGSGKDTAGHALEGYYNVKMAGGLKAMLRGLLAYEGVDPATIERMIEGDLKEVPSDYLAGRSPRYAMQTLGDEWGRQLMGANFWIEITRQLIRSLLAAGGKVKLTDVRYPNEVALVNEEGGAVYRVMRPGLEADSHASEAQILTLRVKRELHNIGTPETLQAMVRRLVA